MRKFLALAALVLGLASCQNEPEGLNVVTGGEIDTVVTVTLPEAATRADWTDSAQGGIANGVVASPDYTIRYILQVFNEEGTQSKGMMFQYSDDEEVVFPVRLVPNRTYNFVVWADIVKVADVDYNDTTSVSAELHYNIGTDLRHITLANTWKAMDETRDAFTGVKKITGYNSASTIEVELIRPFAKLRVITTDMLELFDPAATPAKAVVTYKTLHSNTFDAFTQLKGEATEAIIHNSFDIKTYADNSETDKVLFTDYFFASEDGDIVNFTLDIRNADDESFQSVTYNTPISVKRNYVTTLKGNILTEGNSTSVIITDEFANAGTINNPPYHNTVVTNAMEFLTAYYSGQEIIMNNAFTVTEADKEAYLTTRTTPVINPVINLNGFTLTFENNSNTPILEVAEGNTLIINNDSNEGGIVLEGTGVAIQNNGELEITNTAIKSDNDGGTVIENNAEATITDSTLNNGALTNTQTGSANIENSTLNEGALENNGQADIKESALAADSVVNNGQADIEGSDIATGAVENNGKANVTDSNTEEDAIENGEDAIIGSYIYTFDELQDALDTAVVGTLNEFTLGADLNGDVTVIQKDGVKVVIAGNNKKFNGTIYVHSNSNHYANAALTIKNVNFETSTIRYNNDGNPYFNFIEALENGSQRYSTNITVDGCTFNANGDAQNLAVGVQIKSSKWAKVLECTATNMHSLIQAQSCDATVEVKNCTIKGKNGVAFKQVKAATVENTEIVAYEYGIRFDGNTDNYGIIVKDCKVTAAQPFIVRKMTGANNTITLEGTNTLDSTREAYNIVITKNSDDQPYTAPTGTYTLTGADDLIVYPRDVVSSWAEFTAAINGGKTFFLLAEDITSDANYQLQKDVTIDLNGKSMTLPMINIHTKTTIKNGTINGKVYARNNSEIVFNNVTFSGAVADNLSTEGHLAIQGGCKSLYAKDCLFSPTSVSGSQTKPLSFEGGSTIMKFENCEFKSSPYKKQVYFNSLSAAGSLDFTNCNFNNKTPNIMFAATCPFTVFTMSGTTKLSSVTLEPNRASSAITDEDYAYFKQLIKDCNNSISSVRLYNAEYDKYYRGN